MAEIVQENWYNFPQYYECFFRSETQREVRFIQWAAKHLAIVPVTKVLELGCGGGRLLLALAKRGYIGYGVDNNARALDWLMRRAQKYQLPIKPILADLANFTLPETVDLAICTFNTFRHLLTEREARQHLTLVAQAVRPGGLYILGLHLLPLDVEEEDQERWSARLGRLNLHARLRVLTMNWRKRREWLHLVMTIRGANKVKRLESRFAFRLYTLSQFLRLLQSVPIWQIVGVYDFWYDWNRPRQLNDDLTDAVFILARRPT